MKGKLGKWVLQWGEGDFHQVCKHLDFPIYTGVKILGIARCGEGD